MRGRKLRSCVNLSGALKSKEVKEKRRNKNGAAYDWLRSISGGRLLCETVSSMKFGNYKRG
jgi:hypothetical protein